MSIWFENLKVSECHGIFQVYWNYSKQGGEVDKLIFIFEKCFKRCFTNFLFAIFVAQVVIQTF